MKTIDWTGGGGAMSGCDHAAARPVENEDGSRTHHSITGAECYVCPPCHLVMFRCMADNCTELHARRSPYCSPKCAEKGRGR